MTELPPPSADDGKQISPAALASLTTGTLLCDFGAMHEAAEQVLGHPVWTHEMGSKALWTRMRNAVLAQYPDMPVSKPLDWQALRDSLIARYGETIPVARGDQHRAAGPLETLAEIAGDKQTIALVVEADSGGN